MGAVLGEKQVLLQVRVYDGATPGPETLLFDSDPDLSEYRSHGKALFTTSMTRSFGGRLWRLDFTNKQAGV